MRKRQEGVVSRQHEENDAIFEKQGISNVLPVNALCCSQNARCVTQNIIFRALKSIVVR